MEYVSSLWLLDIAVFFTKNTYICFIWLLFHAERNLYNDKYSRDIKAFLRLPNVDCVHYGFSVFVSVFIYSMQ